MVLIEKVTAERVLDEFRRDQKVTALGLPWPATLADKIALLTRKEVGRPADRISRMDWGLYELDRADFLSRVRPFWTRTGRPYEWRLGEMCAALEDGTFTLPKGNNVAAVRRAMQSGFKEDEFVLIGYALSSGIGLEDGHNRATAAILEGLVPAKVKIYVGK
jgi:hypothetical protein